jgi:hypothetical protein
MRPSTYRKYSAEDIQYIREHLYDDPRQIAKALDAPWRTIGQYLYQIRQGTFSRGSQRKVTYYALYHRKTDELVCSGSAKECAEILGIATNSFYVLVHKILHGKTKKWDIYVENYDSEEER